MCWIGGLTGGNGGTIKDSYAAGSVGSGYDIGGLVGYGNRPIINSYSTGRVSAWGSG